MSKLNVSMRQLRAFLIVALVLTLLPLAFAGGGGRGGGSGSSGSGSGSSNRGDISVPWVADSGRLHYDGKKLVTVTNRWKDIRGLAAQRENGFEAYESDFIHYWGDHKRKEYPLLFYGCTAYADEEWNNGYNDCPTAGVLEAKETMGFGFGTFDTRDIKKRVYYEHSIYLSTVPANDPVKRNTKFLASLTQQLMHCATKYIWSCGLTDAQKVGTDQTIPLAEMDRGRGYLRTSWNTTVRW